MKRFIKTLAVILSVILLVQTMPAGAVLSDDESLAQYPISDSASIWQPLSDEEATAAGTVDPTAEDNHNHAPSPIVGEIDELRDEYATHFRHEDGTNTVALYADPVHYQDSAGKWHAIDNTLTLDESKRSAAEEATYTPAASGLDIRIPQDFSRGQMITVGKGDYTVGLGVSEKIPVEARPEREIPVNEKPAAPQRRAIDLSAVKAEVDNSFAAEVVPDQGEPDTIEAANAKKMELDSRSSAVTYRDIFPDADLQYWVTSSRIKESIIVKKAQEKYEYLFDLSLGGLIAVPREDGAIWLVENAEDAEPLFILEAPYMYDAAGEESAALSMKLAEDGTLALTADEAWINDEARVLPVVIDPTLVTAATGIQDAYISTAATNTTYNTKVENYIGRGLLGTRRTYLHFTLPTLPDGSVVTIAELWAKQTTTDYSPDGKYLYVFDCTGKATWSANSVTWNDQPLSGNVNGPHGDGTKIIDYAIINGNNIEYKLNLTKAVKNWYENNNNNGLMLATGNESQTGQIRIGSTRHENPSSQPVVAIGYSTPVGIESYWSYETLDFGRSGAAHVNDYNGSLTYVHSDLAMTGNRMPISLGHIYNSNSNIYSTYYSGMSTGAKFHLNIQELLVAISSSDPMYKAPNNYRYIHYDGDGTRHYYRSSGSKITHEYDENLEVTTSGSNRIISDPQGNKKYFNSAGQLFQIEDNNGNTQVYTLSGNRITKVTDGVGRVATFGYNSSSQLTSITDPAGRATTFAYSGTAASANLTSITYPNSKTTSFQYTNTNYISRVTADDNSYVTFSYKSTAGCGQRVDKVTQYDKAGAQADYLQFQYTLTNSSGQATGNTIVTNKNGMMNTYLFNWFGSAVNITNQNGQTQYQYAQYTTEVGNEFHKIKNSSDLQTISNNLLKNHGFETATSWVHFRSGSVGSAAYSTTTSMRGLRSMLVQSTNATCYNASRQDFTGVAGQTYTVSADVYIPSKLAGSYGVTIGVNYEVAGGVSVDSYGEYITSTVGWERFTHTVTLPPNATGSCRVELALDRASGSVYFDNVQLEKSGGARYYNLMENSDFSDAPGATNSPTGTSPIGWTMSGTESGDGVQVYPQLGRNYVLMTGSPSKAKKVSQTVPVKAKAGETLIIGGRAAAYATLDEDNARKFGIIVDLYRDANTKIDTDPTTPAIDPLIIDFDRSINMEHQSNVAFYTLSTPCHHIVYSFVYYYHVDGVSFDDAFVYVGNYGAEYTYEPNGLLKKVNNTIGDSVDIVYNVNKDITNITQKHNATVTDSATLTYDSKHNVLTSTDADNIKKTYTYTSTGQISSVVTSKGALKSTETMAYTSNNNYLATYTDARGGITQYTYDAPKGLLLTVTDPQGNTTTYAYNNLTDELISVTGKANPSTPVTTSFTTQDHLLTTISRNNTNYSYGYDNQNRVTTAKVGSQSLVTNTYDSRKRLSRQTYANGAYYEPVYDIRDRVVGEMWNGTQISQYYYNENDRLSQVKDNITGVTEKYGYDFSGRLESIIGNNGASTKIGYDAKSAPNHLVFKQNGTTIFDAGYTTNDQGRVTDSTLYSMGGTTISYTYDDLNRPAARTTETPDAASLRTSLTYLAGTGTNTTGLISQFKNETVGTGTQQQYDYTYDVNGNIKTVKADGVLKATYTYDGLNRLTREDNAWANNSYAYTYDVGGNLTTVKTHAYTTGALGAAKATQTYTYGNSNWKDQLTAFDGKAITYDALGNPLTYDGKTFSWQKGRQLTGITDGGQNIQYAYDAQGRRISKTVGGVTTTYTYSGNLLIRQSDGTDTLDFQYDAAGTAVGFKHNRTPYFYLRNLQGDVTGITDAEGAVVAEYKYDAWGNLIEVSANTIAYSANGGSGSMADTVVQYGSSASLRANAFARAGYQFDGWNAQRASDNKYLYVKGSAEDWYAQGQQPSGYVMKVFPDQAPLTMLSPVNGDTVTMYAQWLQISIPYTIVYNANGGTGAMANTSASFWTPVALSANAFSRTGYQYGGWTAKRSSDNKYLYKNGSTENWYAQGQQPSGYAFKIFADQEMVSALSTVNGDTITMYAQWTSGSFTVVYNANGGSGSMANTTVQYDIPTSLRANAFIRTDYKFEGWTAKRASDNKSLYNNGSIEDWYPEGQQPSGYTLKVFLNRAMVSTLSPVDGDTVTMYAQWSLIPVYTISFDANGGTGTMTNATVQYGVYALLPANTFTRAGYLMSGWTAHRASDGKYLYINGSAENWYPQDQQPSGYDLKLVADQSEASAFSSANGDTITLYAQWISADIAYLIVYNANGGVGTMANTAAAFWDETPLRPNKFTNAGYFMTGWVAYRASDDSYLYEDGSWYQEGQQPFGNELRVFADRETVSALSAVSDDTITMYAQWEPDEYYVPIDPRDLEEPLLRYNLKRCGLMPDGQTLDDLVGAILALDILSLDALRDIYEGEGYDGTETEDLIAALLADYSSEEFFLVVCALLQGEDLNQWLEPGDELWPWVWYLEGLIGEITDCIFDVLDLDENDGDDLALALSAVEQVLMGYVYLIRADQNELRKLDKLVNRLSGEEIDLLYAALETLLSGEAFEGGELDLNVNDMFSELAVIFSELDENDVLELFSALLPFVLTLEVPNLENIFALCEGWGYTETETEEAVVMIITVLAMMPLQTALFLSLDEIGGAYANQYANGPLPPSGGCVDLSAIENMAILASANFYPMACAIRGEAASMLGLDLQDEGDVALGTLISAIFLYCYFADYIEHVNLWRVANGEEPIDFGEFGDILGGAKSSQVDNMIQQMDDQLAEQIDNGKFASLRQPGFAAKLSGFAQGLNSHIDVDAKKALDTGLETRYNDDSGSVPARGGSSGPDIGELNPIRYRGYYQDAETGYYFLQTRYYSPEWRRFINADVVFIAGDDALNAANLYAYCNNNPVMLVDPNGMGGKDGWEANKNGFFWFISSDTLNTFKNDTKDFGTPSIAILTSVTTLIKIAAKATLKATVAASAVVGSVATIITSVIIMSLAAMQKMDARNGNSGVTVGFGWIDFDKFIINPLKLLGIWPQGKEPKGLVDLFHSGNGKGGGGGKF